ncbi:hypothetical protein BKA61DRAFT_656422 [Leptodontidium sp. MPI-SDFR-AT-0119]|nr:hypothetical protein BKA61DRAFT_656422 [Leptodontidium sp. MPI-SDFR-AT-0119]
MRPDDVNYSVLESMGDAQTFLFCKGPNTLLGFVFVFVFIFDFRVMGRIGWSAQRNGGRERDLTDERARAREVAKRSEGATRTSDQPASKAEYQVPVLVMDFDTAAFIPNHRIRQRTPSTPPQKYK